MIQLIADSGSTTTDWAIVTKETTHYIKSAGINPFHQDDATIAHTLSHELCSQLTDTIPTHIYFYGAGCVGGSVNERLKAALQHCFADAHIEIASDLLGAARSLCGTQEGIAGILGTGANSCHYDGKRITHNVPPLGYILGDEGSGSSIGKAFLRRLLRGELGKELLEEFYNQFHTDYTGVIGRIYREPAANRFLASLSPFIASHIDNPTVQNIVQESMNEYLTRHIMQYNYHELPLHLTGSVAYYYRDIISKVAYSHGIEIGQITPTPIEGLITYHTTQQ